MEFTKYYSDLLKAKGIPHIEVKDYQKIFNIMTLEIRIEDKIKKLTDGLEPKEFLHSLIINSVI